MQVVTSHQCVSCEKFRANRQLEPVVVGTETFYACDACVDALAGPGKHEGVDESDRALCLVLGHLAGISFMDHWLTDDYSGYVGVVDRFMLVEDERGFVDVRTFKSADEAMRELNSFEDDGFGASEWDGWISSERNGYAVSLDGKTIGTYPRLNRALAAMAIAQRDAGYYPNTFLSGEHGPSVRRIEVRYLEEQS